MVSISNTPTVKIKIDQTQEEEDGPNHKASDNNPHPICPLGNAPGKTLFVFVFVPNKTLFLYLYLYHHPHFPLCLPRPKGETLLEPCSAAIFCKLNQYWPQGSTGWERHIKGGFEPYSHRENGLSHIVHTFRTIFTQGKLSEGFLSTASLDR